MNSGSEESAARASSVQAANSAGANNSVIKTEDEARITKLIIDYMCWWDDRVQHRDYPSQLDGNAKWELWEPGSQGHSIFLQYEGKRQILKAKEPNVAIVHSTSNIVIFSTGEGAAEARAYFRTYLRKSGSLHTHGEGRYKVAKIDGEWRLMSIHNYYYWYETKGHASIQAFKVIGMLAAAMLMGAIGGVVWGL